MGGRFGGGPASFASGAALGGTTTSGGQAELGCHFGFLSPASALFAISPLVLKRASLLSSYTFRYTFLYVP